MSRESELQSLCERGQDELMRMEYLRAEATLVEAERLADQIEDFDTLSRLYMPLQEARRQRRQRCGEGVVRLDLISRGPDDQLDAENLISRFPHGQLLVAGWGTAAPAARSGELHRARGLYLETFLAAAFPVTTGRVVVLVPLADVSLPKIDPAKSIEQLRDALPHYCVVLDEREVPAGEKRGTWETYAHVMSLWERLHAPFLAAADAGVDPLRMIEGYRRAIEVDYACELAHQKLAAVAHELARQPAEERTL